MRTGFPQSPALTALPPARPLRGPEAHPGGRSERPPTSPAHSAQPHVHRHEARVGNGLRGAAQAHGAPLSVFVDLCVAVKLRSPRGGVGVAGKEECRRLGAHVGAWARRGLAVHPAWAAWSDLAPPSGSPSPPSPAWPRSPQSPLWRPGFESTPPPPAPHPVPSPPPKSPPLSVSPPRARSPGARPPPPASAPGSTHALRPPGSQRRAGPRSPCVLRGRRRGEAASAAGEGGGGQRHRQSRGGSERRRGGRDAARTAADTASHAGKIAARIGRRAPDTERGSPWWSPAVHAQSALAHCRAAAGRRGQRPPDPAAQTQVSGQREAAGAGMGGAGLGRGVWRVEIGRGGGVEGKRDKGWAGGGGLMELGGPWDLMNVDMKEYIQTLHPTVYFVGMTWLRTPLQRTWGAPKRRRKPWSSSWHQCGGGGGSLSWLSLSLARGGRSRVGRSQETSS